MDTAAPAINSIANELSTRSRTRDLVGVAQSLRALLMGLVVNASRNTLILITAGTMAVGGSSIQTFFTETMASGINGLVTGTNEKPEKVIDKNLVYTAVAMAAIKGAQGLNDVTSADNVQAAGRASLIAALGVAGPPMTAAAMLLMYKVALALFVGLGPIFILCLLFEQTKSLFSRWLLYGIGTMFSLAVLSVMVELSTKMVGAVAASILVKYGALGAASSIASELGFGDLSNAISSALGGADGITSMAMQQGGLGLVMSTLIISAPPMAASFVQGTLGSFQTYSPFGSIGAGARGDAGANAAAAAQGRTAPPVNTGGSGDQTASNAPPPQNHLASRGPTTNAHTDTLGTARA